MQAVTRGDGTRGDEITSNARTIRGLPLRLHTKTPPAVIEVRGEAYIANTDFAALLAKQKEAGKEAFANPRNTAAGALKLSIRSCARPAGVRFMAHGNGYFEGIEFQNHMEFLHTVREWGIPITPKVKVCPDIRDGPRVCEPFGRGRALSRLRGRRHRAQGERLRPAAADGPHEQSPRWLIAYKWEKYEATTLVGDKSACTSGKRGR